MISNLITQDMTASEMAHKIFYEMDVLQSCKIEGFEYNSENVLKAKGELVCDDLWAYDRKHNTRSREDGTVKSRIKRKPPNSIGGYLADKIFKWAYVVTEETVKYTIWRIQ